MIQAIKSPMMRPGDGLLSSIRDLGSPRHRFVHRRVLHVPELETRAENAMTKRVNQHVRWVSIGLALKPSTEPPECKPTKKGGIHERSIQSAVVFQEESPACLEPVIRSTLHHPSDHACRCSFEVNNLALRNEPGRPSRPPSSHTDVNIIKIRIQSLIEEPDLLEHRPPEDHARSRNPVDRTGRNRCWRHRTPSGEQLGDNPQSEPALQFSENPQETKRRALDFPLRREKLAASDAGAGIAVHE